MATATLREQHVVGSFVPEVEGALVASPELVRRLAHQIVTAEFPPSLAAPQHLAWHDGEVFKSA